MYLSKYGVARHIYIAIPKAGSANHAVGADWTPSAGDVKISKDGGAAANVTNLPTAIAMGNSALWDFSITATEMQAAQIVITVADSATKAVDDTGFSIETYGNASGQHVFDLGTASVAQTGDNYARIGAPAGASVSADIAAVKTQTAAIEVDTGTDIPATLVTIDDFLDTEVAAIKAKTDQLTFTTANQVDATTVTVATGAIGTGDIAAAALNEIADAVLDRNMATGTDSGSTTVRTPRQALRAVRNKVAIAAGTATIYKEDDATSSWTAAVTTTAGDPISAVDPAGP